MAEPIRDSFRKGNPWIKKKWIGLKNASGTSEK
jgi:hypothetical protein